MVYFFDYLMRTKEYKILCCTNLGRSTTFFNEDRSLGLVQAARSRTMRGHGRARLRERKSRVNGRLRGRGWQMLAEPSHCDRNQLGTVRGNHKESGMWAVWAIC